MSVPTPLDGQLFLGTVAIEPNRWATVRPDRSPSTSIREWLDEIAALGVDGLELWEGHVPTTDSEAATLRSSSVPVRILNSYVGFGSDDPTPRRDVTANAKRLGATGVKFNVGDDPTVADDYARRLADWVDDLGPGIAAICECHMGNSIAEDPVVAARILGAAGPPERVQALVHTHDDADLISAKFDALGERITHVHVNHLDFRNRRHPPLAQVEDELAATVDQLRRNGFAGSWTLEFVAGLLTEHDHPAALLEQAALDLAVLRPLLDPA